MPSRISVMLKKIFRRGDEKQVLENASSQVSLTGSESADDIHHLLGNLIAEDASVNSDPSKPTARAVGDYIVPPKTGTRASPSVSFEGKPAPVETSSLQAGNFVVPPRADTKLAAISSLKDGLEKVASTRADTNKQSPYISKKLRAIAMLLSALEQVANTRAALESEGDEDEPEASPLKKNGPIEIILPRKIEQAARKPLWKDTYAEKILNYWLSFEMFDLPECPSKGTSASRRAEEFLKEWDDLGNVATKNRINRIGKDARLVVQFQCHRAGYLNMDKPLLPNMHFPRTFLVAQAMIPQWDKEEQVLRWTRSEDDSDLSINKATLCTLYKKLPNSIPQNLSLPEWISERVDEIKILSAQYFTPDADEPPFTTKRLNQQIIKFNRALCTEFWANKEAQEFMQRSAKSLEAMSESDDFPSQVNEETLSFRWRYSYFEDKNTSMQLGPFFVESLEQCLAELKNKGPRDALSAPLYRYLKGAEPGDKILMDSPQLSPHVYKQCLNSIPKGRWAENPDYGLSLLQACAVGVVSGGDPVVGVNGPPGTGKTTLLKDVMAVRFVERTERLLSEVVPGESGNVDWKLMPKLSSVLDNSMVVASSNNKAVENISKELPSLSKIDKLYRDDVSFFKAVADEGDWGQFCAVLGNSTNRKQFKAKVSKLKNYLYSLNDHFQMQALWKVLKSAERPDDDTNTISAITSIISSWVDRKELVDCISDIKTSGAMRRHKAFLGTFVAGLEKIEIGELEPCKLAAQWVSYKEEQWQASVDALESLKKEFYARRMAKQRLANNFKEAKAEFETALHSFNEMNARIARGDLSSYGLDVTRHIPGQQLFNACSNESTEAAEERIQLSSPYGSREVNEIRTQLFISALKVNEALICYIGDSIRPHLTSISKLIDGRLESNDINAYHEGLWSLFFLLFPVASTSLASVDAQFKLMRKKGTIGLCMLDESGQSVNYHVVGLLQRSSQAVMVGDPIQLEPVVTMQGLIDRLIAMDFIDISESDENIEWGDELLVTNGSVQSLADRGCRYEAQIGDRTVGIPLLVHRRCTEPMFSIANRIAYGNKMVCATQPYKWNALPSGWVHVEETAKEAQSGGKYRNVTEAKITVDLIQHLVENRPDMVRGGVYVITPFTDMASQLRSTWQRMAAAPSAKNWVDKVLSLNGKNLSIKDFATECIGTVHTFQGKEASTVIICGGASAARKSGGGINWVNSSPNLINVAVTRAKHHLFVIGNQQDWELEDNSRAMQDDDMYCYKSIGELVAFESDSARNNAIKAAESCYASLEFEQF